ncbi:MAG: glycosyltransferase family 4 protein [Bacteroidales bacterium]|jgi:glycosyltransferase involved in cell wall biosynthesis|nr:glycosyltransferase family 4 protein [Bacteroidales bacterium]
MGKKILYTVPHRFNRSPGQRFRCEHFIPHLEEKGFSITYSPLLSEWDDTFFYKKGAYIFKLVIFFKAFFRRIRDIIRAPQYDIIFIYREAFMLGTTLFERIFSLYNCTIIYDFDDSIWLHDTSEGNENLSWLKKPSKINTILRMADLVIVGNEYLATYARQFSQNVEIIPTTIDTNYHNPSELKNTNKSPVVIGWTGTETTHRHFSIIETVLQKLHKKHKTDIEFHVISNIPYNSTHIPITWKKWSLDSEIENLQEFDIGIMPLPNDSWSQGKCGFKGLQYMSLEIPTIMSPVGINTKIINHGTNGFLAQTEEEWLLILEKLIQDTKLRESIGKEGRKTILSTYSVEAHKEIYRNLFTKITE